MADTDKKVQELFQIVQKKKAEISKLDKPNWMTNCSFSYSRNSNDRINIQTVSDVDELVNMLAFLIEKTKSHHEANFTLETTVPFKWMGFSFEDWKSDLQTRVNKIQIGSKKKELENLESRLNALISPELKAKLELDAITQLLEENK
jgi:hypothetical protein